MYCVCGEVVDIFLVELDIYVVCVEMFDDEIEWLSIFDLFMGVVEKYIVCVIIYLKIYYVIFCEKIFDVIDKIKDELKDCWV